MAAQLLHEGATVRRVREALEGARRLAPGSDSPLAELRLQVDGARIVVEQDRRRFDARTGQALLDFPAHRARARGPRVPRVGTRAPA